jgi:small-conductance mechanosensitive channel
VSSITSSAGDWFSAVWNQWHVLFIILVIVASAVLLRLLLQIAVRRTVNQIVSQAKSKPGSEGVLTELSPLANARLVQRARTVGSVLGNFITWSIVVVATTLILGELGVAVGALATGAGLIGAGLGFGSQALVRDLISGLFIVFEDQYGVGDTVDLGEASGVVESVGLRVTQVRDAEGTLWYVRNGEIVRVGNKSQGWSRVVLDLALPVNVEIDRVEQVMLQAAQKAAALPEVATGVIGEPEVWGVQLLSGDQIVIRLVQKVKPTSQDQLARLLRLEVKKALDKAKIDLASSSAPIFIELKNGKISK